MNENCKYKCIVELCPYVFCLKQNCPVECPKDKSCEVYNLTEYNTDTSAGHPKKIITNNQFVIIGIALSILQIGILLFYILG